MKEPETEVRRQKEKHLLSAFCLLPSPNFLSLTAFRLPAPESSVSALDTRPEIW
jgi:hypothetical protein